MLHTHASPEAAARCYGCSHPELLEMSEEDILLAQQLVAGGWVSTSNRYRTVKLVVIPPLNEVVEFKAGVSDWLREKLREEYLRMAPTWRRMAPGVERVLTVAQFHAFKRAGGQAG